MDVEGLYLGATKGGITWQQGNSQVVIDFALVSDPEEWEEGKSDEEEEEE